MSVIPALFREAETDHPAIAQCCSTILAGDTARLLLLGPHWSGKSHTAYAALRRLTAAGYRERTSPSIKPSRPVSLWWHPRWRKPALPALVYR